MEINIYLQSFLSKIDLPWLHGICELSSPCSPSIDTITLKTCESQRLIMNLNERAYMGPFIGGITKHAQGLCFK